MDDEEYVRTLLRILSNPAPSGVDPADPYGQADDGIDRYNGFGRDVQVEALDITDGPHGDELRVTFRLSLPPDPRWRGVPTSGSVQVPFDVEWRHLSGFTDPADYAPQVALRVESAADDHARRHGPVGRREEPAGDRAALPNREEQQRLLLQALNNVGRARQVSSGRFELVFPESEPEESEGPDMVTLVATPENLELLLMKVQDIEVFDLTMYLDELLSYPDPDERFVVFYEGDLVLSTREKLPPVRGRARERRLAELRAGLPPDARVGRFAYEPPRGAEDDWLR